MFWDFFMIKNYIFTQNNKEMKTKLLSAIAIAALLASCSSSKKTVETTEAKQIKLTPELAEGKTLFENNCGKCHKLFSPDDFTKEEWPNR